MNDHDDPQAAPDEHTGGRPASSSRQAVDSHPPEEGPETTSELSKVRGLILSAFTDLVPELVGGQTVDDLIASVDVARDAYRAIAERMGSSSSSAAAASVASSSVPVPRVPAGGAGRQFVVNIEELSPSAKIAEGLRRRAKSS